MGSIPPPGFQIIEPAKKANVIKKKPFTSQPDASYLVNESTGKDTINVLFKEKKSAKEKIVCGACGQHGHMRTNKNCPKYRENYVADIAETRRNEEVLRREREREREEEELEKAKKKKKLQPHIMEGCQREELRTSEASKGMVQSMHLNQNDVKKESKSPETGPVADVDDEATFLAMARDSVRVTRITSRLVDSLRLKVEKAKAAKLEAERALQAAGEASEIRQELELELERETCSELSKDLLAVREKSSEFKRKWAKLHWESDKLKKENEKQKKESEELKKEKEELKKENEELKSKNHRLVVELDSAQVAFEGSLQEMKVVENKLASSVKRLKVSRDRRQVITS